MAKVAASKVASKLKKKLAKAHEAHKNDPTEYGIINLPSGIKGGIAQLQTAEIKEHPADHKFKGEIYVNLVGIIKSPNSHKSIKVAGQRATLSFPLYDVKRGGKESAEEHYADLLNELRKFGVDTSEIEIDDLETTLADLQEEAPYFAFSTRGWTPPKSADNPDPSEMVFTSFDGLAEYDGEDDPDSEVDERKEEAGADKGETDYAALGKDADAGSDFAIDALTEKAGELELDPNDYGPWADLATAIAEAEKGEGESEGESPTEGTVYLYDGTQVVVTNVNEDDQTADVEEVEGDNLYEGVPWADLEEDESE